MKKSSEKQIYRTMLEFEKEFFPKSFKERMAEKPTDAQALGVSLAKESLQRIERKLARQINSA